MDVPHNLEVEEQKPVQMEADEYEQVYEEQEGLSLVLDAQNLTPDEAQHLMDN